MIPHGHVVAGIDVGGEKKGFHAVALRNGVFNTFHSTDPSETLGWCLDRHITVVAVDAPSGWSQARRSRQAERELILKGMQISCFSTPTRTQAVNNRFYGWVLNGEQLYRRLASHYPLFEGERQERPVCFETFPHAVFRALAGRVAPAKPKASRRREMLLNRGYDVKLLTNLDFVDAALCAMTAEEFRQGHTQQFGGMDEGFIVVPAIDIHY